MKKLLTLVMLSAMAVLAAAGLQISSPVNGKFQYSVDGKKFGDPLDTLQIFNGKKKHAKIDLKVVGSSVKNGVLTVNYSAAAPKMEVKAVFTPDRKYLRSDVYVNNLSGEELHLLIHQVFPVPYKKFEYWNGSRTFKRVRRDMVNKGLHGIFPMACVYEEDGGIAAGLSPEEIVNHMENGCRVKGVKEFFTGIRMVLAKGEKNEISFVSFAFAPEYKNVNAVADYQEYKPEFFRPAEGIDPRIAGTPEAFGDTFYYGRFGRRPKHFFSTEPSRRMSGAHGAWTWGYAAFVGTGDWLIRPDQYKYPDDFNSPRSQKNDPVKYITQRRDAIQSFRKPNLAYTFYLLTWLEKKFAEKHFPEAILTDKRATNIVSNWVLTGGTDVRVLIYGNRLADMTIDSMNKVAKTLNLSGFCYDCAAGVGWALSPMPGVDKHPGRAYDDNGKVYVREAVGYAMMMDHTHTLKNQDGYKMGVAGGVAGRMSIYFNTFRSDCCLTDATFSETFTAVDEQDVMRYMLGSKIHNFCVGIDHERHGATLPWRTFTRERIKEFYDSLRDMMLLFSFHRGFFFDVAENWGCEKFVYYQPILSETLRSGYQTVPALRDTGRQWHSRYGKGLGTIYFIGNQMKKNVKLTPKTDNKYIGKFDYLFAHFDGKELANSVDKHMTAFPVELKSNKVGLYRTVAQIAVNSKVDADASFTFDCAQGKAVVDFKTPYSGKITFRMPESSIPVEIKLNGKVIAENSDTVTLPDNTKGKVEFTWKSAIFKLAEKELQEFPFVTFKDGKAAALPIVLPADPAEFTRYAGERFAEYFPFFYRSTEKREDIAHELITTGKAAGKSVILQDDAPKGVKEVFVKDGSLVIRADSPRELINLVNQIALVLDKKFWYYGVIGDMYSNLPILKSTREIRAAGGVGVGDKWPGIE